MSFFWQKSNFEGWGGNEKKNMEAFSSRKDFKNDDLFTPTVLYLDFVRFLLSFECLLRHITYNDRYQIRP